MSVINVTFDTKSKALSVEVDGSAVDNCQGITIFPSWDDESKYRCIVQTGMEDEENDTKYYTSLVASQNGELIKTKENASAVLRASIASLFSRE